MPEQPSTEASQLPQRRTYFIAAAFVAEIVIFSIVTFVIAYVNAQSTTHDAGQHLADSMVDTVSGHVLHYIGAAEWQTRDLSVPRGRPQSTMMPSDTAATDWYAEWLFSLRARMLDTSFGASACSIEFDDASLVAVSKFPSWLEVDIALEGRTVKQGYRRVAVLTSPR